MMVTVDKVCFIHIGNKKLTESTLEQERLFYHRYRQQL